MIKRFGRPLRIYAPAEVLLDDLNSVPTAYTYVGTTPGQIMYGKDNDDEAVALGVMSEQYAFALLPSTAVGLVGDRYVLLDGVGRAWMLHARPAAPEIPGTVTVKCLCTLMTSRPEGLPSS